MLPKIVSDGAGGAVVAWQDQRGVYAQRVNAAGVTQWIANGVALCTATNEKRGPTIASDGAGGAIVTWQDRRSGTEYDIYAQRISVAGVNQWIADGVAVCIATNNQQFLSSQNPMIVSDGMGGAIITWFDYRSGSTDIYAQRVNAAGATQWIAEGVALCTAVGTQTLPTIATNGAGGAIVTWGDFRNDPGTGNDIYAQNVSADGTLGGTLLSVPLVSIVTSFAIGSVQPNPSVGDLRVSFSLSDGSPAMLELYDLAGRRIESLSVGGLGPGAHVTSLTPRLSSLRAGVYCVRLTQGNRRAFSKVAIVR